MQDWNEIVVFVKVVETGGFQRAAELLGLPKSSVSRKVASLEARLGVRLLHRTTRTTRTTEIGQSYYDRLARLVADAEVAERAVLECQSEPTGTLRVSIPTSGSGGPLARAMFDYAIRYPRVRLEILSTDRHVDMVRERVDVAIRAGELRDESLIARKLGQSTLRFVASPKYLDEHGRLTSREELREHQGIALGLDGPASWQFADGSTIPITGRVRVTSMANAIDAAAAGLGVALVAEIFAARELETGTLERVLPDAFGTATVAIVYPSRENLSTNVRSFVDHVVEQLGPETWDL